jgi:hypothetical protein
MRLIDFAMKHSTLYRTLYHNYEQLREQYALVSSANGAGSPGHANCDSELLKKFTQLEADYRALERENQSLLVDAMVGRELRKMFATLRSVVE